MSVVVQIATGLTVKLGDFGYGIVFTIYTPNGDGTYTLKDLTAVTAATLKIYRGGAAAATLLTKSLTILPPAASGQVQWPLAAADTTAIGVGTFAAEVQLTASGYQESTSDPFSITIAYAP